VVVAVEGEQGVVAQVKAQVCACSACVWAACVRGSVRVKVCVQAGM